MCALNPKFHYRVTLNLYTSNPAASKESFEELIFGKINEAEQLMNADGQLRCHASNPEQVVS
jgi:hypothetical protein